MYDPPNPWMDERDRHRHMGMGPIHMLRGRPLELDWMGWRSNTAELQHMGWEFAESRQDDNYRREENWHLAMRHPGLGISGMSTHNNRISFGSRQRNRDEYGPPVNLTVDLGMPYMVTEMMPMQFIPIDARPQMMEIPRPSDLYYMPYFQPMGDVKDIFLKAATVEEIMQMALDKQEPHQAELRAQRMQDQRRSEYRESQGGELKARILLAA